MSNRANPTTILSIPKSLKLVGLAAGIIGVLEIILSTIAYVAVTPAFDLLATYLSDIGATPVWPRVFFNAGMQIAGRAIIIGEHSPGGLTEMYIEGLSNGALLGYPVAQLVTSDGRVLEGVGITPDVTVTLERDQLPDGIDAQLQAAIYFIRETSQAPGFSVFTVAKGDQVFFGGNDNYINPDSYYWVDPAEITLEAAAKQVRMARY